jgi:hypothetical protein
MRTQAHYDHEVICQVIIAHVIVELDLVFGLSDFNIPRAPVYPGIIHIQ